MALSGHAPALEERRFNHGHHMTPSGRAIYPIARGSEHHRSINQKMPELWSDYSDRGLPDSRAGHCERAHPFHGDLPMEPTDEVVPVDETHPWQQAPSAAQSRGFSSPTRVPPAAARPVRVLFAGYAEFDMDGRSQTAGEMDRLMSHAAACKYPCSRPATFDEYAEMGIMGLPTKNTSGRDVVFVGPGATGCELFHTNTHGAQKAVVPPGDAYDGTWGTASLYGRKVALCVYPVERVKRQQSLTQFGLARSSIGKSGRLKKAGSLASLSDQTKWTSGDFAGSSSQAQRTIRMDQFFR